MHLVTILGATCSGKSQLAIDYAKTFTNQGKVAWIVSCDSRQVYKDFNLASAKIPGAWKQYENTTLKAFYYQDVPHFLVDFVDLNIRYSLVEYIQDFVALIKLSQNLIKPPDVLILCGGTGLYARAINQKYDLGLIKPEFEPEYNELKAKLQKQNLDDLLALVYQDYNSKAEYEKLNNSEKHNPPRIVNLLLKSRAKQDNWHYRIDFPAFESNSIFGIRVDQRELALKIQIRIEQRITNGMLQEIQSLITKYGHERIAELGLEGSIGVNYWQNKLTLQQFQTQLLLETIQYAKRQQTWLNKEPNLEWIQGVAQIHN